MHKTFSVKIFISFFLYQEEVGTKQLSYGISKLVKNQVYGGSIR